MISTIKKIKKILLIFILTVLSYLNSTGQQPSVENSLLWEVTGNGLKESSFLFGSFHLLGSDYVDSLANVTRKFNASKTFVSEILFDSTMILRMVSASIMKDSTLDQLLPPEYYDKLEKWLQEVSPFKDLSNFNQVNPAAIQMLLVNFLQEKIYGPVRMHVDTHFETRAMNERKKIVGLETLDDQLDVLYGSTSYRRHAEKLTEFIDSKNLAMENLVRMNTLYRIQNLSALENILLQPYDKNELENILMRRNKNWMITIPSLFHEQSTFVVVGVMHLTGGKGLVTQLRKSGYFVTPISLH